MCGEHEDAKVLAEYIVVMVAGNKGREEMTVELKPFFQDQVQAESFVDWVEECKWKFLTGGTASPPKRPPSESSPPPSPSPGPRSASGPEVFLQSARVSDLSASPVRVRQSSPAPAGTAVVSVSGSPSPGPARSRLSSGLGGHLQHTPLPMSAGSVFEVPPMSAASPARSTAQPVAVVDLQKLPSASALLAQAQAQAAAGQQAGSAASSAHGRVSSTSAAAAARPSANAADGARQKTELLKDMTKQLQVILTKLNDKSLNDGMREKYQAMAQTIQTQMAKITKLQGQQTQQQQGRRRP